MGEFMNQIQDRVRSSTSQLLLMVVKILTAALLGLTLALIFQELIGFGIFSFILIILVVAFALLRIMKPWTWGRVLIFDLICVLVALLLRMYILIAPGA